MKDLVTSDWFDRSLVESSYFSQLDDVFNDFFNKNSILNFYNGVKSKTSYPKLDIYYKDDSYHIDLAIPGMQEKDISVDLIEGNPSKLKISGQKIYEENNYMFKELRKGSFERIISLPSNIKKEPDDAILKDGILKLIWKNVIIKLPKKDDNVKRISIKSE